MKYACCIIYLIKINYISDLRLSRNYSFLHFSLVDIFTMFTGIFAGCESVNSFSGEGVTSKTIFGDK